MNSMQRWVIIFLGIILISACSSTPQLDLYTIGIFQINENPTLNDVRRGFIQAFADAGYQDGKNIRFLIKSAGSSISEVQRIAQEFIEFEVDMIVPFSTPCLQAALHASREIPIVFSSVANPYLAGAGISADDHLGNVSGVASEGPIKQGLVFLKRVLPTIKRLGTLWTPSELNSNFYLERTRQAAAELDLEIVAVPIANSSEVLLSAQSLINKKIDVIFQISDNTINDSFEALGTVAMENSVPLFGGNLNTTSQGACAALGWDFYQMGIMAGKMALRVKNGENLQNIPIQYMKNVLLYINLNAAERQGIKFSAEILAESDKIIEQKIDSPGYSE